MSCSLSQLHRAQSGAPVLSMLASAVLLAGCAGMQQAPLVYSSQVAWGADLASTSAANPGLSLTVGYKQTDVAYVPLAVAPQAASGVPGKLETIAAEFGQDESARDRAGVKQALDARLKKFEESLTRVEQLQRDEDQLKRQRDDSTLVKDNARLALNSLAALPAVPSEAAASDPAAAAARTQAQDARLRALQAIEPWVRGVPDVASRFASLTAQTNLSELQAALKGAEDAALANLQRTAGPYEKAVSANRDAKAEKNVARQALDEVERLLVTKKRDAMSVYGSFNALADVKGTTTAPGLSAGIGKVFSTGLAAQNLSEAAKTAAVADCVTRSMTAFGAMQPASAPASAVPADVLAQVAGACGRTSAR